MEPRGLDFLMPIWQMMQTQNKWGDLNDKYIGLTSDQVRVYYTKYVNDFKPRLNTLPGQTSIRDAAAKKLINKFSLEKYRALCLYQ